MPIKGSWWEVGVNLPGIEETVIKKAVPPGGDLALHFALLKLAISPNVGNSDAQFLVVGDCVCASPDFVIIHVLNTAMSNLTDI